MRDESSTLVARSFKTRINARLSDTTPSGS
jgi:hypothetical protein